MQKFEIVSKIQSIVDDMLNDYTRSNEYNDHCLDEECDIKMSGYINLIYSTYEEEDSTYAEDIELEAELVVHVTNEDSDIMQIFEITDLDLIVNN
jgi:hypothetical protein